MINFELEQRLPSCTLSLQLLERIEEYLLARLHEYLAKPKEELLNKYVITIVDDLGSESLSTVKDFPASQFRDSTTEVSVGLHYYDKQTDFRINIRFKKERTSARLTISTQGTDARERAVAFHEGVKRLIEPFCNRNWIFHLPVIEFFCWILSGSVLLLGIWLVRSQSYLSASLSFGSFVTMLMYAFVLPTWRPYITFESKSSARRDRAWNWFVMGILGFIIFGTLFSLVRKKLFGF